MSALRPFIANISWNLIGKTCVQLILFAVSIGVTRYLGKDQLGIYATLLVIPVFVRLLNQLGLETLINKKLPEINVQDPSGQQGRYLVKRVLAVRAVSSLVFCFLIYLLLPFYLNFIQMPELLQYRTAILFYFLAITLNSLFSTLFMTLLRYKVISIVETLGALLNLILLIVFIYFDRGISGVLYAYIFSSAVTNTIFLALSRHDLKGPSARPKWGEMQGLAWTSYGITLFSFGLMTQSDVFLMNYFQVEPARIGYYYLATGLGAMLAFVLTGVGPLGLSLLSETHARESSVGLARSWREIVSFAAFLTTPIFVFAFFNAESLITLIYGAPFAPAGMALSLYILFFGMSTILGMDFTVSTLFILHRRDAAMRSTIEGSVLNVVLNLILIPLYGEIGAVAATGAVMLYMVVRQLVVIQKQIDIRPAFATLGKCFLFSFVAVMVSEGFARMVLDHIILNAVVFLLSFVILLIRLKPFTEDHRHLLASVYPKLDPWFRLFAAEGRSEAG